MFKVRLFLDFPWRNRVWKLCSESSSGTDRTISMLVSWAASTMTSTWTLHWEVLTSGHKEPRHTEKRGRQQRSLNTTIGKLGGNNCAGQKVYLGWFYIYMTDYRLDIAHIKAHEWILCVWTVTLFWCSGDLQEEKQLETHQEVEERRVGWDAAHQTPPDGPASRAPL